MNACAITSSTRTQTTFGNPGFEYPHLEKQAKLRTSMFERSNFGANTFEILYEWHNFDKSGQTVFQMAIR